ncbi:MAG: hypothetical protein ACT4O0_06775 [Pseudonocardia sp.]
MAGLALVAVLGLEVFLLRDRLAEDLDLLREAGRSAAAESGQRLENPAPPVVRTLPAAADPVTGVDLRAVGRCEAGVPCPVRLLIRLRPRPEPTQVTWSFQVLDRCPATGAPPADVPPADVPPAGESPAGESTAQSSAGESTAWSRIGGTVLVAADGDGVALVDTVALPAGRALAVTAVTGAPAVTASAPLLVPARASC